MDREFSVMESTLNLLFVICLGILIGSMVAHAL
jgi:hypothetical protein